MTGTYAERASVLVVGVLVAGTLAAGACSGDGDEGDIATFCSDHRSLADSNPFATLEVASPGEIATAFEDLSEAAHAMESSAPDRLDRLATEYSASIEKLIDLLAAAEFDPRYLDTAAYRRATIEYDAAATALSNETVARCD